MLAELLKHASWAEQTVRLFHYQREREDIDFIIENNAGEIAAVEVKAAATIDRRDRRWLERLREARLYRYTMPVETFEPGPGGTHWVSRETIEPLAVGPMGDVLTAIAAAGVELRITPRLGPLWRRVTTASTLEFSGTRLRNAIGHPTEFG